MKKFENVASCASADPDAFFTEDSDNGVGTYRDTLLIQRICAGCPAKAECLDYALHNIVLGYWANTTEYQRSKLRRQLNIIPRPLYLDYN